MVGGCVLIPLTYLQLSNFPSTTRWRLSYPYGIFSPPLSKRSWLWLSGLISGLSPGTVVLPSVSVPAPCCFQYWVLVHSRSVVSDSWWPRGCSPQTALSMGILQARILAWAAISFSRGYSQPGIKAISPALQADSLQSEPLPAFWLRRKHWLFLGVEPASSQTGAPPSALMKFHWRSRICQPP